jgi:hypothetical protein
MYEDRHGQCSHDTKALISSVTPICRTIQMSTLLHMIVPSKYFVIHTDITDQDSRLSGKLRSLLYIGLTALDGPAHLDDLRSYGESDGFMSHASKHLLRAYGSLYDT